MFVARSICFIDHRLLLSPIRQERSDVPTPEEFFKTCGTCEFRGVPILEDLCKGRMMSYMTLGIDLLASCSGF